MPSSLFKKLNASRAFTFGISRTQMKNIEKREKPPVEQRNPYPGSYATLYSIGKKDQINNEIRIKARQNN